MKKKLTQKRLKECLCYDQGKGSFTKLKTMGRRVAGSKSGHVRPDGYVVIMVDYVLYQAHRLVWLYTYGYFPETGIDHINRNPSDNRLINLREVSQSCNMRNARIRSDNTSGIKGISWNKNASKWSASIHVQGNKIHIGYYKEICNAVCARLSFEQCLKWEGCDSSSQAFKYVQDMIK